MSCDRASAGRRLLLTIDGRPLPAREGQTVAAALLAAGRRTLRHTARRGEPRGLFCGMGVCFDCLVQIDGRPNVRACQAIVAEGMRVETQVGHGSVEGLA
jgi:predicted molibdopterin-dependent oxidoreductase YjgC